MRSMNTVYVYTHTRYCLLNWPTDLYFSVSELAPPAGATGDSSNAYTVRQTVHVKFAVLLHHWNKSQI